MSTAANQHKIRQTRKLLLQLQADAYRLEMAAHIKQLQRPFKQANTASTWISWLKNPLKLLPLLAPMVGQGRVTSWLKLLPIVLTAWKIAGVLRKYCQR
ncbi:hypothetical protein HNQ59_001589 [Chitinivorax tropicus]|uniref:Uncharacterized protein n=1 Tax=Chitinivorax tropicus TaxID=714531 RepID=A0A840MSW3_9PROT|nr:hypothetical protein [Chitinivorax tropicus]MBB5018301.1 hypothetical protein [Chitinivorax tropicus]